MGELPSGTGGGAEASTSLGTLSLSPGKAQAADKVWKGGEGNMLFVPGAPHAETTAM